MSQTVQSQFMVNFGKPLREMSDEELERGVEHWPMGMISVAVLEIQRRQHDEYAKKDAVRISKLVKEIGILKSVTEQNARISETAFKSSDKKAWYALCIAIATLFVQVIFSTQYKYDCRVYSVDINGVEVHSGCYSEINLGLLGTYSFERKNIVESSE